MPAQQVLDVGATAPLHRLEMGDRLASSDDREVLASVLYRVEQVREVAGGVGCRDIRHLIRLSDYELGSELTAGEELDRVLDLDGSEVSPAVRHRVVSREPEQLLRSAR